MPSAVQLGTEYLYTELPEALLLDLMADILWRYESLFLLQEPIYLKGKPELVFDILKEGYALAPCAKPVGVEVINLRFIDLTPSPNPENTWKEEGAGRQIAKAFSATINP